ncbi:MAG: hypothetical protein LQ342_006279 [Letrouitia transgressa]|nr:MAG: hypothetical protein LQ342_006279 [Letrouitia transgressa]
MPAWWIAFGPHGPRAEPHPDEPWWLFTRTLGAMVLTLVLFIIIRQFAREPPRTMNKEWQEATNEYLKSGLTFDFSQSQNTEPITGVSSEGYKGRGMVQSRPRKGPPPENEEE